MIVQHLFLSRRFYLAFASIICLLAISFSFSWLFPIAQTALVLLFAILVADVLLLFQKNNRFEISRQMSQTFSLSDKNKVSIRIKNQTTRDFDFSLIDEIPVQFQERDLIFQGKIKEKEEKILQYELRPTARGTYSFGAIHLFVRSKIGLAERRISNNLNDTIAVYPSILQMKQHALYALENISQQEGIKKMRKIGHSYEFEQIKEYVRGDDYRSINWKASGRQGQLMVNQYTDEKSQQIYCIIDKSRNMRMPFNELSLMDYAINTTLTMSNIAIQKQDRAGLITFSDKIGSLIKADRQANQLHKILHALYNEQDRKTEGNYELLYHIAQKIIKGRSLILLFTNFESQIALERVLPTLRQMNAIHLLVVVLFENTEIATFSEETPSSVEAIYHQTIAKKFIYEKRQMVNTLKQFGIQAVLTKPEDLSINTINKYLEMKSRGLI